MKLPTYSEALKMGKEKVGELLIPCKIKKAQKQAELEMCKLEETIATKTEAIQTACTKETVDFPNIIKLQDELALVERKLKQYKSILDQMFPSSEGEQ